MVSRTLAALVIWVLVAGWLRADAPAISSVPPLPDAETRIREALNTVVDLQLTDGLLGEFAQHLETKYHIPVVLDTAALTADGKGAELPINVHLADVRLRTALNHIGNQEGLAFVCHEEKLLITTRTAEECLIKTEVYAVGDLLDLTQGAVYPPAYADAQPLIDLIENIVALDTWRDAGGTQGAIQYLPQRQALAVSQTARVHEEVELLLEQFRKARPTRARTVPAGESYVVVYRVPLVKQASRPSYGGGWSGGMSGGTIGGMSGNIGGGSGMFAVAPEGANSESKDTDAAAGEPASVAAPSSDAAPPPEVVAPPSAVPYISFEHTGYLLPAERDAFVAGLEQLIDPESWHGAGGDGRITVVCDKLYVRQSARGHEQIRTLVDALWDAQP